jgi:hypothetical protein
VLRFDVALWPGTSYSLHTPISADVRGVLFCDGAAGFVVHGPTGIVGEPERVAELGGLRVGHYRSLRRKPLGAALVALPA